MNTAKHVPSVSSSATNPGSMCMKTGSPAAPSLPKNMPQQMKLPGSNAGASIQGKPVIKGECSICRGSFKLQLDGRLYRHGGKAIGSSCSGSLTAPVSFMGAKPPASSGECASQSAVDHSISASSASSNTLNNRSVLVLQSICNLPTPPENSTGFSCHNCS